MAKCSVIPLAIMGSEMAAAEERCWCIMLLDVRWCDEEPA